ncbi:hypothetical protein JKP88DRAFT_245833 [Tribonema minus]|uniref:Uncharacterized protein n=1 Tax=Tribonema minus TaxID=303371 RepID=A0A836CFP4_9STRA|nr:hypothetical protein JKP88DRAFT_245833 [Tribonema minus]
MEQANTPIIMSREGDLTHWTPQQQPAATTEAAGQPAEVMDLSANGMDVDGTRPLFGGAMKCQLPPDWRDLRATAPVPPLQCAQCTAVLHCCCELRQVPDNQEVYVDADNNSIVVELLELQSGLEPGSSARHYFQDLAAANESQDTVVEWCADVTGMVIPSLPQAPKCALIGTQFLFSSANSQAVRKRLSASEYRTDTAVRKRLSASEYRTDTVRVFMIHVTLPEAATDLLITLNQPLTFGDSTTAAAAADTALQPSEACFTGGEGGGGGGEVVAVLQGFLRSFEVVDWAIFC